MKTSARLKRLWFLALVLVTGLSGCAGVLPGLSGAGGGKIRVLVVKGVDEVSISGSSRGDTLIRARNGAAVDGAGRALALPERFRPGADGFVYIDGKPYRGAVEVHPGDSKLMVIDELDIESYLVGLINSEISSKWPMEVIKAQAVAARTYAMYRKARVGDRLYHLEASVLGQAYNGTTGEDSVAERAVRETRGQIIVYGDEPALAVYHSNAGGATEASRDVWQQEYPYLVSVPSPYDDIYPRFSWEYALPADTLAELLNRAGFKVGLPEDIYTDELSSTGRVRSLVVRDSYNRGVRLRGEDLRRLAGYSNIRSTMFEVSQSGYVFLFKGKGSGHGVGMSQWGAKGMAEDGYTYREILGHYYPGTRIKRAW